VIDTPVAIPAEPYMHKLLFSACKGSGIQKRQHTIAEPVRNLVHQSMPCTWNLNQMRTGDPVAYDIRVLRGDDYIIGTGDYECVRSDLPQPVK